MAREKKPPSVANLTCGSSNAGAHRGGVVGCCHVCGLLLCEEHVYYLEREWTFGRVDNVPARPLACETHRGQAGRKGLPSRQASTPAKRWFSFFARPTARQERRRRRGR